LAAAIESIPRSCRNDVAERTRSSPTLSSIEISRTTTPAMSSIGGFSPALEDQRCIAGPEPKAGREGGGDRGESGHIWNIIEVAGRVGRGQVDRWRDEAAGHAGDGRRHLDRAAGAEQMSEHRLRRADRHLQSMVPEGAPENGRLERIVLSCRRSVRTDV